MPQPTTRRSEENDVPFFKTELGNQPVTTGKPLDASDEPGRADAEMAQDEFEKTCGSQSVSVTIGSDAS